MKNKQFQKPLFEVLASKKEDKPKKEESAPTPKRRGRPPKQKQETVSQVKVSPKKDMKIGEKKKIVEKVVETKSIIKPERGWKDFNKTKPDILRPCEFYVQDKKGKQYMFFGYIKEPGCTVTDDPYKLVVLRKRFGNLFYRELKCLDISNCPNSFPDCEKCKLNKKSGGK